MSSTLASVLVAICLQPSRKWGRQKVGDFEPLNVNGKQQWAYKAKTYDLADATQAADYNATVTKLSTDQMATKTLGGIFPLVLLPEASVARPLDLLKLPAPRTVSQALHLLPLVLSPEEATSLIAAAGSKLAALQATLREEVAAEAQTQPDPIAPPTEPVIEPAELTPEEGEEQVPGPDAEAQPPGSDEPIIEPSPEPVIEEAAAPVPEPDEPVIEPEPEPKAAAAPVVGTLPELPDLPEPEAAKPKKRKR
jgi:hypothetical protein